MEDIMEDIVEIVIWLFVLVTSVALFVKLERNKRKADGGKPNEGSRSYPYRPGIEFRLPNGRITTRGYAARHPAEFPHWRFGPNNVHGENIDLRDWEDWRLNYYGE